MKPGEGRTKRLWPRFCLYFWPALPAMMFAAGVAAVEGDVDRFRALYEKEWAFRLGEFPRLATSLGDQSAAGALAGAGEVDHRRRYEYWKGIAAELAEIDSGALPAGERANHAIFERQILSFVEDYEFGAYLIPLNSDWGFHIALARLPSEGTLDDAEDYDNYLARLAQIPRVIDQNIALMRAGLERGMTLPAVVLKGRDVGIRTHVVDDVEKSVFYQPFRSLPDAIDEAERKRLRDRGREIVTAQVIPAYARFLKFFNEVYRPGARTTLAASVLPRGEDYYPSRVRYFTTLALTPAEIHEIGLGEVSRILAEMEAIIAEVAFDGSFADFLGFLRTDSRFYAQNPRELLMTATYFAKKMDGRLPSLFKTLPRQPYGVAPVPEDLAPFFTGGRYVGAPIDGQRPGYYWVNTHALETRPLYTLPALTLHEAVPGHHLQSALAQEQGEQPPFRRHDYISAYGEGWGLYAEWLGVEAEIYETPYEHFGRLTYEMWRACRLVVDTGIHALGWGRQRSIDYLAEHTALSLHEVTTEIDRYISWPAQALSYKLGELKIKELRQKAAAALGADFDLRVFHDLILAQGSVPLPILEQAVDRYLAETKQRRDQP